MPGTGIGRGGDGSGAGAPTDTLLGPVRHPVAVVTDRSAGPRVAAVLVVASLVVAGCPMLLGSGLRSTWAYETSGVQALLDEGLTGAGVRVAIVDTGIDDGHPDLEDADLVAWNDLVNGRDEPYDDNGHGTHVAGVVVAQGKQSDLAGGAPGVELMVAKAIGGDGQGSDAQVANAIDWARTNDADVVSLSLGGQPGAINLGSASQDAAQRAVDAGVYVVAAAGNQGEESEDVASPGNVRGVVSVGAVTEGKQVASFSNRGASCDQPAACPLYPDRQDPNKKPELVAPGVSIASTWRTGEYRAASGTSQAVPFVTSGVALALEDRPSWQREGADGGGSGAVQDVKETLMQTAEKTSGQDTPHDRRAGYGIFQAELFRDRL